MLSITRPRRRKPKDGESVIIIVVLEWFAIVHHTLRQDDYDIYKPGTSNRVGECNLNTLIKYRRGKRCFSSLPFDWSVVRPSLVWLYRKGNPFNKDKDKLTEKIITGIPWIEMIT